ncbi:MAG: DEAD/DEAH box helicase, partial [Thermoanaerobaculia bacterium]
MSQKSHDRGRERIFHPAVTEWFEASFSAPTEAQRLGWQAIAAGESTLISAPTGSGKTLAAFLWSIERLMFSPAPAKERRCRVVYVSPLKALAVDVERNLRAPAAGIARIASARGESCIPPTIAVRTGDTPSRERAAFQRRPADILITTPESLYLLLTSKAREVLRSVDTIIIDEIHALVPTKRGSHLALSVERLEELADAPLQRIGLSATQRPLEEVARFLGGTTIASDDAEDAAVRFRPVTIIESGEKKKLQLEVEVPVDDMSNLGEVIEIPSGSASQPVVRSSIWPAIHPRLLELIHAHRSTLIFVNSRRLAERLAAALNELAGEIVAHAHHGSLARPQRIEIEDRLKSGELPALVATSSLELGIDMGAIDLVIQIEAPPSVASGMQRIGRAGHHVGSPSEGTIFPKHRADLLACAAVTRAMHRGEIEPIRYPRNPLDVLAQQIVAIVAMEERELDSLYQLVRRAAPFARLTRNTFEGVLDMLAGVYPAEDFAELRARINWDRLSNLISARAGARNLAVVNGGTIPDRGLYGVFLAGAEKGAARVGELDEEMVFESESGETFVLGASTWRIEEITHDRVIVSPAPGQPGKVPFWHGDGAGRSYEFGVAIGALTRTLSTEPPDRVQRTLVDEHDLDARAAANLLQFVADQRSATEAVPDDRTVVIERCIDELGDWRLCILSPFGARVHAPWAMAAVAKAREQRGIDVEAMWSDEGLVLRFPETEEPPDSVIVVPEPDELEPLLMRQLGGSSLFASRFREAAARALLLPRRRPGARAPLWQQRKRAHGLLQVAARFGSFPIILEAYRECLQDVFDLGALRQVIGGISNRSIRIATVDTDQPSPFAASILFRYVANYIYDGDAPLAERRAQALALDQSQLRELLGEAELRDLLDEDVIAETGYELQCLAPERKAKNTDGVHDLLVRLGALSHQEIEERSMIAPIDDVLADLLRARRIISIGGTHGEAGERFIAVEDAARYRDALGIPIPAGIPERFLLPVPDPLGDLVLRYARTHG